MSPWTIPNGMPSVQRYRPAIYLLTAITAAFAIYYIHDAATSTSHPVNQAPGLHRSNAQRRRRTRGLGGNEQASVAGTRVSTSFLGNEEDNARIYGWHNYLRDNGESLNVPLRRSLPSDLGSPDYAELSESEKIHLQLEVENAFLNLYLYHHLRHRTASWIQDEFIVGQLEQDGFSSDRIRSAISLNREGGLRGVVSTWVSSQAQGRRPMQNIISDVDLISNEARQHRNWEEAITVADSGNENSLYGDISMNGDEEEENELLRLLYLMAEEESCRTGHLHRGITCNSCHEHPIKGIRYRCSQCLDFDLCSSCEAQNVHPPTHLLYKIRIPRPHLGRHLQPIVYPGKYPKQPHSLSRQSLERFTEQTGFKEAEVEGLWEQFLSLASAEWPDDPVKYCFAIDRRNFEQLLFPSQYTRPPAPNLIYDRIFSFFDINEDNLIGFNEFIEGLANLRKRGPKVKWKRIFSAFDIDRDGFINRKDFLRMFEAHYKLTKEMTAEVIANIEEESYHEDLRELVAGGQPISSAFTESLPSGQASRSGEGKILGLHGDDIIVDHKNAIVEDEIEPDVNEIIAQSTEIKQFGDFLHRPNDSRPVSIRNVIEEIYEDPWPPYWVKRHHVDRVFPERAPTIYVSQITNHEEQLSVRRASHAMYAWQWHKRHLYRWWAVRDRRRRRSFFTSTELPANTIDDNDPLTAHFAADESDDLFKSKGLKGASAALSDKLECLVKAQKWCINTARLHSSLMLLFKMRWKDPDKIAENLRGFARQDSDISCLVADYLTLVRPYTTTSDDTDAAAKRLLSFRQRKSFSQDRLQSQMTSPDDESESHLVSQSPRTTRMNGRWKEDTHSEAEEDVGQEILFQITREALNEVIDPFFKPREDLWLEAQATKVERQRFRVDIYNSVKDPGILFRYLNTFLKQALLTKDDGKSLLARDRLSTTCSEADIFRKYLACSEKNILNDLTSEECLNCKRRILLGQHCRNCGGSSAIARHFSEKRSIKTEKCNICADRGRLSHIREDSVCPTCGNFSKDRAQDSQWLWTVLSGGGVRARMEQEKRKVECFERLAALDSRGNPSDWTIGNSNAAIATMNQAEPLTAEPSLANIPSGGSSACATTPTDSEGHPGFPMAVDSSRAEGPAPGPVIALDLHRSVELSDNDIRAAQKRLDALLQDSGYSSMDSLHAPPSSVHPNAPQRSQDQFSFTNDEAPSDPTLPQNRPSKPILKIGQPPRNSYSLPNIATLKFWAVLTILEAEDNQRRGGPGRISEEEFVDIMLGERGRSLEFVGDWMNLTTF